VSGSHVIVLSVQVHWHQRLHQHRLGGDHELHGGAQDGNPVHAGGGNVLVTNGELYSAVSWPPSVCKPKGSPNDEDNAGVQ